MKVGVDAVLLGAWVDITGCRRILDVGTGCGIIALMLAQRSHNQGQAIFMEGSGVKIEAVEIDEDAATEAEYNFGRSPWSDCLSLYNVNFKEFELKEKYDLIVSNPPYFDSGVTLIEDTRQLARHQSELSPYSLLDLSRKLLNENGRVAMIVPAEMAKSIRDFALCINYCVKRYLYTRGNPGAPLKRILIEFEYIGNVSSKARSSRIDFDHEISAENILVIEEAPGIPMDDYRKLCAPFYLKY